MLKYSYDATCVRVEVAYWILYRIWDRCATGQEKNSVILTGEISCRVRCLEICKHRDLRLAKRGERWSVVSAYPGDVNSFAYKEIDHPRTPKTGRSEYGS